jgi:maltooligosyltrehalose trehalohydrolase
MPAVDKIRKLDLGATVIGPKTVSFKVWAPKKDSVSVEIKSSGGDKRVPLDKNSGGYFTGTAEDVRAGDCYYYILDHDERCPDPASRFQPEGVHGPSQVVDPGEFFWTDNEWRGISLRDFIIYELHIGTFTREGNFESIIPRLDYLSDLGITAIELMPVAQFPGNRNWGYDGVYPFAPQKTYGGPEGFKKLIDAAHGKGLALVLDVVYNHLGPEGNYLGRFGPYFTDRYRTPWGDAINFDGPYSDDVKHFFIENALYWVEEFHVDGLRLDAVHGIFDFSARHFLRELCDEVHSHAKVLGREITIIAESDLNDVRIINPPGIGGYGLDAQWDDDFHHSLHTLMTGERRGYYEDFGDIWHLEKVFREGFAYTGQYSRYRKRRHGNSPKDRPASQFIVFSQSHDQVGNRLAGDRSGRTLSLEKLKLAAGVVIFSPFVPLLFMGEEYAETAPFYYFTSHSDHGLGRAVREGRQKEFAAFEWKGNIPDPQDEKTFFDSRLNPDLSGEGAHRFIYMFYRELLRLRKSIPPLRNPVKDNMEVSGFEDDKALYMRRWIGDDEVFSLYNFGEDILSAGLTVPDGTWEKTIESSAKRWGGKGESAPDKIMPANGKISLNLFPHSFVLYRNSSKRRSDG